VVPQTGRLHARGRGRDRGRPRLAAAGPRRHLEDDLPAARSSAAPRSGLSRRASRLPLQKHALSQLDEFLGTKSATEEDPRVVFVRHHVAHAASAFFLSDFEEANIISLDGSGGQDAGLIGVGRGIEIEPFEYVDRETSWGYLYERYTERLGFRAHNDEGKVMGLAAYGDARGELFPFLHVNSGDGFPYYDYEGLYEHLHEIVQRSRDEYPVNDYHEHVAARLQYSLEQAVAGIAERLYERTGLRDLCLAGGTALNCSCNGKLLGLPFVDRVFIQPAASDSGTALGAAVYVHVQRTGERPRTEFDHAYWGPEYSNEEIEAALRLAKVPYRRPRDVAKEAAQLLAEGKIVGWFQGRMEVGPRALGGRSILAHPGDEAMKDAVNNNVKFREPWRPFAPSILAEYMEDYFGTDHPSPFMILAFEALEEAKRAIPAALHVDGTGRPQTVDRHSSPRYWELINEFRKLTGIPVVLNTSFNIESQPIVCTPKDALSTFFMCGLDALAIGDFILEKPRRGPENGESPTTSEPVSAKAVAGSGA
jgi:carbamoyltransferase